jgi:predicted nucleotidyltransferase
MLRDVAEQHVIDIYRASLKPIFGSDLLAAWLTGSFAYGGGTAGKSDIDVTVIVGPAFALRPEPERVSLTQAFIDVYLATHIDTGFHPDLVFPGECVTVAMIDDAIAGRGFEVEDGGHLSLPRASQEYYLSDCNHWFRAWLSQTAFSRFLLGDEALHARLKRAAWNTIIKYTLLRNPHACFVAEDIFRMLRAFGVHSDYWNFARLERDWVGVALTALHADGIISEGDGTYRPCARRLAAWEAQSVESISRMRRARTKLLFDMAATLQLGDYARESWARMNQPADANKMRGDIPDAMAAPAPTNLR